MKSSRARPKLMFALAAAILVGALLLLALNANGKVFAVGPPPPSQGPAGQLAPTRPPPLKPPPPHTGYIPPPMDLSHLKGDRMPKGGNAAALPSKWDWRQQGVVTQVQNQGACGSCFTFASLANFESKLQIDGAGTYDFSENNAKECNWEEVNDFEYPPGSHWGSCDGGNYFMLANLFSQKGTALELCDPYVDRDVGCKDSCPYIKTLLDWRYISYWVPDTNVLKGYIYNHGPVYTSIYAGYTEFRGYDGSYTLYHPGTESPDHAVLIVGWDDDLSHAGGMGGWIVKNSWGTTWGDNGYFYIAYGSASIGMDSSSVYAWQDYDPNGDIMHYDEAGWWSQGGCSGSTTGWGLSKFIPTSDTYVTRVEFWTTDRTTDIDVHIYDDFDGTTHSNLLWSDLDNSFYEAGYHGVVVDPPLAVNNGDDVILVVKFTNASYEYPIPVDTEGPNETGRTYLSCSGSAGSWQDVGVDHGADVAIRLRTSDITAPTPTPTQTATPTATQTTIPCDELICNGGFEAIECWDIENTQRPAGYSTTVVRSGSWSMRLGITYESDAYSWSPVYQQVTIPANAASATLSFWYYPICQDSLPYDWQEAIIYDHTLTVPLAWAMPKVCSNSQTWTHQTFDLTPYKGQTIILYFNVKNDGVGNLKTAMYLDDVSIQVCRSIITPTPTPTPTPTTGTPTPTGTPMPGSTIYLPIITKLWPPVPDIPVLHDISNPDGDGNYMVCWSTAARATGYTLEEDDNSAFSSPTIRYSGSGTCWTASDKEIGTYYYRVMASNSWGNSGWSNVQSVSVHKGKFYAVADTPVLQGYPNENFGSTTDMWVGYDHCVGGKIARSLVQFDVSSIPAGTPISQVTLYLYLANSCDIGERTHTATVYRTKAGWSESSVTWNTKPGYAEAYGSASIPSRTWGWYSFDVTGLVRGWVNGSLANYGLMIRGPESSGNDSAQLGFYTRDKAGRTYDPYLSIAYTGMATSEEAVPAVEGIPNLTEYGPTIKDVLSTSPGASDFGMFEVVEGTE